MHVQLLLRPAANCTVSLLDLDIFSSFSVAYSLSEESGSSRTRWDTRWYYLLTSLTLRSLLTTSSVDRVCFLEQPSRVSVGERRSR